MVFAIQAHDGKILGSEMAVRWRTVNEDIPIISLVRKGSKRYPRYIVTKADPFKNPLFWNGLT